MTPYPMKPKYRRYGKMKQNYDYEFLSTYDDFENLSQYIRPFRPWEQWSQIGDPEHEEIENTHGWENPLKEYVIFKAVAIFEQSFRNLLVFLIDDLKLNIQESLEIGNKITISIDDLNKFSNDKATKGFIITDSISGQINRPFLINQTFSKILKLNFDDTLKNLHIVNEDKKNFNSFQLNQLSNIFNNNQDDKLDTVNTKEKLKDFTNIFNNNQDDPDSYSDEFERIFQLRNLIAHNSKHAAYYENESIIKNDKMDLHRWLRSICAYVDYAIKLIIFYSIFCTKFDDFEKLAKKEIFPRVLTEKNYTVNDIKEFFEREFGASIEKVSEYVKSQQDKYQQNY